MTARPEQPRHPFLPDRDRSHAVLAGSSAGLHHWMFLRQPEDLTGKLAHALTRPGASGAFHWSNTTLLLSPRRPADVLDPLRQAAEAASDVLLFFYAGKAVPHQGELLLGLMGSASQGPSYPGVAVSAIAGIMGASRAARPLVILDCGHAEGAWAQFATMNADPSLLAAGEPSFEPLGDPFTHTLVDGLTGGVEDGPELLDLRTLKNAMEAAYTRTRFYVENEYIGGPSTVLVRGGRRLALGINPAFGRQNRGALPADSFVVHEEELGD